MKVDHSILIFSLLYSGTWADTQDGKMNKKGRGKNGKVEISQQLNLIIQKYSTFPPLEANPEHACTFSAHPVCFLRVSVTTYFRFYE